LPAVETAPGHGLKRRARKLVRLLARRYRLRLTPELEAYLIEIVLRPKSFGGRRHYGLGLNHDALIGVLQVLWLNFGDLYGGTPGRLGYTKKQK
jgi:hypothetical protein